VSLLRQPGKSLLHVSLLRQPGKSLLPWFKTQSALLHCLIRLLVDDGIQVRVL